MRQAPPFSIYDPFQDREVTHETYAGRPLLITFWTSWCPDAQRDLQKKELLYAQIDAADLAMLNVNVTGRERDNHAGRTFARANAMRIPMAEDRGTDTYERYRCEGVPTTVIITPDGKIAKQFGERASFGEMIKYISPYIHG